MIAFLLEGKEVVFRPCHFSKVGWMFLKGDGHKRGVHFVVRLFARGNFSRARKRDERRDDEGVSTKRDTALLIRGQISEQIVEN